VKNYEHAPFTSNRARYWEFGQYGRFALQYRPSDEVARRLAEAALDGNAPRAARAYALVHAAHHDAFIASQDGTFHYRTARPDEFNPSITTGAASTPSPSYRSNAAAIDMASAMILGHIFPRETSRYMCWALECGDSRVWADIQFRGDVDAGWELGRRVGRR
jgi:hypothetical protein